MPLTRMILVITVILGMMFYAENPLDWVRQEFETAAASTACGVSTHGLGSLFLQSLASEPDDVLSAAPPVTLQPDNTAKAASANPNMSAPVVLKDGEGTCLVFSYGVPDEYCCATRLETDWPRFLFLNGRRYAATDPEGEKLIRLLDDWLARHPLSQEGRQRAAFEQEWYAAHHSYPLGGGAASKDLPDFMQHPLSPDDGFRNRIETVNTEMSGDRKTDFNNLPTTVKPQ